MYPPEKQVLVLCPRKSNSIKDASEMEKKKKTSA